MVSLEVLRDLATPAPSKLLLFVIDGLGGLPHPDTGRTELETAHTPNLDALAARSLCGLSIPVALGISPGSGPGHLALFGYDPLTYRVGRGVLSALGVGFPLEPTDVAARFNFATVDAQGRVIDRRAGRLPTEVNRQLVERLRTIQIPGVQIFVETESGHRGVVIFRGEGLSDALTDSDPQREGLPPLPVRPLTPAAQRTAEIVNRFISEAAARLNDAFPANMILLRGFARHPNLPTLGDLYQLRAAAVAVYPMYKGLARLVGMTVLPTGETLADQIATLRQHWAAFDFFYLHTKGADTAGEDGDFARKVRVLEEIDQQLPALLDLRPDVLVITGDHSTPAVLRSHSWHPVPYLLWAATLAPDSVTAFGERACAQGGLGLFPAVATMRLMLAHGLRLKRYGA